MADDKKRYGEFTYEDIQLYLSGKMLPAEMNALEKAALEDPFLAEAIEGFANADLKNLSADIESLKEKLNERTRALVLPIWRRPHFIRNIAASAVLLIGIGFTLYFLNTPIESPMAVNSIKKDTTSSVKDLVHDEREKSESEKSAAPVTTDSNSSGYFNTSPDKTKKVEEDFKKSESRKAKQIPVQPLNGNAAASNEPSKEKEIIVAAPAPEAALKSEAITKSDTTQPSKVSAEYKSLDKARVADNDIEMRSKRAADGEYYYTKSKPIKGKIRDNNNKGVPFANIRILNSNRDIYADAAGNFSLTSEDTAVDVAVKSVGFVSKKASVSANKRANTITMIPSENALEEIVANSNRFQNNKADSTKIEDEDDASPVDGWDNYDIYLANNLRVPIEAITNDLHGEVELSFTVNKNGFLSDFKIEKGISPTCDKEAIRLVRDGPKWQLKKGLKYGTVKLSVSFL